MTNDLEPTKPIANDTALVYKPLGESADITLTYDKVRQLCASPTRSGKMPTTKDMHNFMLLCRARRLNPFIGEAWLVGYDSKDGPQFSIITSIIVLQKRAESNPQFDGIESGITVLAHGKVDRRRGTLLLPKEELIGGWAEVYRKDRSHTAFAELSLKSFDKGTPFWQRDPGGMICKCARAAAYREAFPSDCGDLYTEDERRAAETVIDGEIEPKPNGTTRRRQPPPSDINQLLATDEDTAADVVQGGELLFPVHADATED